ncbi:MAG: hypothetical protein JSS76_08375 [Bacteroidetes bacterium]|nr:hypothetical protein [Bacteroidota bacterium]
MIKHAEMLSRMNTGEPFDVEYIKIRTGEKRIFKKLRKQVKISAGSDHVADHTRRRSASSYTSLTPFACLDGTIVEIYTRLIIKFNNEDVAL